MQRQRLDTSGPAWLLIFLAALPVFTLAVVTDGLQIPHPIDSAVPLMEARSFVQTGILPLHGLPVSDNPPLLKVPDYYPNWPPLAPIILSGVIGWWATACGPRNY